MIVELVGTQFKRSYLTDEIDNPFIIVLIKKFCIQISYITMS